MQFNFVFKDQSGRIKYRGSDVGKLSDAITSSVTLTKAQTNDLAKYVYAQWKETISGLHPDVASSATPWRARDYRADLLAGISKSVSGSAVSFKIEGDQALAAEFGWGVPNSPDWEDGIGQYAGGNMQDLRPWLLHPASPHVKSVQLPVILRPLNLKRALSQDDLSDLSERRSASSRSGASRYRVLRYDAPELSTIIDLTAAAATRQEEHSMFFQQETVPSDQERRDMHTAHAKRLAHTARSNLETDKNGNLVFRPLGYGDIDPEGHHLHWVYHRASLASKHLLQGLKDNKNDRRLALNLIMQKARFTVFRTITDSFKQIARRAFFTKGISPARSMEELKQHIIPYAIANILAGKKPDGSS